MVYNPNECQKKRLIAFKNLLSQFALFLPIWVSFSIVTTLLFNALFFVPFLAFSPSSFLICIFYFRYLVEVKYTWTISYMCHKVLFLIFEIR